MILKEIQDVVIKYANIISQVIRVDVEIVSPGLVRIAGTGIYEDGINEDITNEGFVYQTVLKTGKPQIIDQPGKNKICLSCPKQLVCAEKFEMSMPIKLNHEIIGIIGLICFTDEQKEHLLDNFNVYSEFLAQISEFISIKAYEKQEHDRIKEVMNLLTQVIDKTDKGVLVFNKDNYIAHVNQSAIKQLNLKDNDITQRIVIESTGDSLLDNEEYKLQIGNKEFYLIGQFFPVSLHIERYTKILIFEDIKVVKSRIYDLINIGTEIELDRILGDSVLIRQLKKRVKKIAQSTSTILITGESGTGKEMFARAIHRESDRKDMPFVAINCGAIPDTLLESELFGYVKGAFTGADPKGKIGKFELANKGMIFLDEIGDMPLYLQVKLLRVLQERKIARIGSNQLIDINVRVLAATNKDLGQMIRENQFREDLYYRLNVIPFEIPPLRDRKSDIEELTYYFVSKYSRLLNKAFTCMDKEVIELLITYPWPGNVRELENTVEFMVNMMERDGILHRELLPKGIIYSQHKQQYIEIQQDVRTIEEIEKQEIEKAMKIYGNSTIGKKRAAAKLGIGIATLYRKMDLYKLSK